ncbi:AAA family ATPase [Streptomyces sp. NPDC090106]|uniref:AAA family ATPase n=1 Tax=Streptomyces sp. NPDC090106 TaxID=3365946 RepID=UPI0037F54A6E
MIDMTADLPENALIVLIGASGAGKSTLASSWPASQVLSLDTLRGVVSDDPGDQEATSDAVDIFKRILVRRMARGLTTVIDATNLEMSIRVELVVAARRHGMPAVAVIVSAPLSVCLARQNPRPGSRRVPDATVRAQHQAVPYAGEDLTAEGFTHVVLASELPRLGARLHQLTEARADIDHDLVLPHHYFGPEILPLWRWLDRSDIAGIDRVAEIRLGSQHLTLALAEDVGLEGYSAFDVLVGCPVDAECTARAWAPAHSAADLYQALLGIPDRYATCTVHGSTDTPVAFAVS